MPASDLVNFTTRELVLMRQTAELYREYCELPTQHPDDAREFVTALHQIQLLIQKRPGFRIMYPDEAEKVEHGGNWPIAFDAA